MTPGGPGKGTARTTGSGLAMRGLVNPSSAPTHMHEGKAHPKSESLSKKAPSATIKSRKVVNTPGSVTTSKTKSSGGKKTTAAYDAVVKSEGTKIVDPSKITPEMTAAANAKRAKARATDKANSASSSSSSKTVVTKPSRKVTESSKTISKGKSAYDIQRSSEIANKNDASKRAMNKELLANKAATDSIRRADKIRGGHGSKRYDDTRTITRAVQQGNIAAKQTLKKGGLHTDAEIESLFSSNYGQRKGAVDKGGYANKMPGKNSKGKNYSTTKFKEGQTTYTRKGTQLGNTVPGSKEDVGVTKRGNKKGSISYGKANPNTGSRGSRG